MEEPVLVLLARDVARIRVIDTDNLISGEVQVLATTVPSAHVLAVVPSSLASTWSVG